MSTWISTRFHKEPGIPQQDNGYDCGVFIIMCARALAYNQPLNSYHQDDMQRYRLMIGRHILRGSLLDSNNQSLPYMYGLASTNPVQNQSHIINANTCAEIQSNRQSSISDSSLKTCNNIAATSMMKNEDCCNRDESDDSDDSDNNRRSQAVYKRQSGDSEDSEDFEEDRNDVNNNETIIDCSAVILKDITSTKSVKPTYGNPKSTFTACEDDRIGDYNRKTEGNIKLDAAFEDQSDSCKSESNHFMHAIKDNTKSIRLKTNAASHKRTYWKKKQDKKLNSNDYKAGLLSYNDLELQSFTDGQQLRHR